MPCPSRRALRQRGLGARSDRRHPLPRSRSSPRRRSTRRHRDRRRRDPRSRASAWSRNTTIAPGRSRLRSGLDAQPGAAAPAQRHRGRRAALRTPGQLRSLRQFRAARRPRAFWPRTAAANPACGATASPAICRSCCCGSRDPAKIELVRQLVQAHAYWRLKGLAVDLVIWNEDHSGYRQLLQDQIMGLIAAGTEANVIDRPGGIFVRPPEQMSDEDRILLQIGGPRRSSPTARGTLADQTRAAAGTRRSARSRAGLAPRPPTAPKSPRPSQPPSRDLIFFNGLGGFTPDGREYVITTTPGQATPAPWVNVLANPQFGTVVSESGARLHLGENAHEFRLTPWYNDPVTDPSGEAFYLRDEETGHFWSPTPLPCRGSDALRHPPRLRLQHLRARRRRHSLRAVRLRRHRRAGQILRAQAAQRLGPAAPALGDRLCGMGAGRPAAEIADARGHRGRPDERRAVRAQSLQHRVRRPGRLRRRRANARAP